MSYSFHHRDIKIRVNKDLIIEALSTKRIQKINTPPPNRVSNYALSCLFSYPPIDRSSRKFSMFNNVTMKRDIPGEDHDPVTSGVCYTDTCNSVLLHKLFHYNV